MTDSSYYFAWLIYIVACTGICYLGWQLIKAWVPFANYTVITPILILLLTPYFSDPNQSRLAPAILTVLFEGLFGDIQISLKAATAIGVLLIPGIFITFMLRSRRNIARSDGL